MKHRKEEDDLYRKFARQREEEEFKFKEEFRVSVSLPRASLQIVLVFFLNTNNCMKIKKKKLE